jgi:hypothetical protein
MLRGSAQNIGLGPGDRGGQVLDARGLGVHRREAIVNIDSDHAVLSRPQGDIDGPARAKPRSCERPTGYPRREQSSHRCGAFADEPDTITAYDVGSKNRFLDDRRQVPGEGDNWL